MTPITFLIAGLFVVVAGLLGYGALAFSRLPAVARQATERRIDMRREVLWTGMAAALLLAAFLYAH